MIYKYIYDCSHTSRKQRVLQTYHLSDTKSYFINYRLISMQRKYKLTYFVYTYEMVDICKSTTQTHKISIFVLVSNLY